LLEVLVDCLNKREITKLRHTFSSEIKGTLRQALNANWSTYERKDPILNQISFSIENIGNQQTFLSEKQVESFIPQVNFILVVCYSLSFQGPQITSIKIASTL